MVKKKVLYHSEDKKNNLETNLPWLYRQKHELKLVTFSSCGQNSKIEQKLIKASGYVAIAIFLNSLRRVLIV